MGCAPGHPSTHLLLILWANNTSSHFTVSLRSHTWRRAANRGKLHLGREGNLHQPLFRRKHHAPATQRAGKPPRHPAAHFTHGKVNGSNFSKQACEGSWVHLEGLGVCLPDPSVPRALVKRPHSWFGDTGTSAAALLDQSLRVGDTGQQKAGQHSREPVQSSWVCTENTPRKDPVGVSVKHSGWYRCEHV